jgi:hypothetical protein
MKVLQTTVSSGFIQRLLRAGGDAKMAENEVSEMDKRMFRVKFGRDVRIK